MTHLPPIWGVRDNPRLRPSVQKVLPGDFLAFYVMKPVSGIVGFGRVESERFIGDNLIWPDEKEANKVIYPHRFNFSVVHLLSNIFRSIMQRAFKISPGVAISTCVILRKTIETSVICAFCDQFRHMHACMLKFNPKPKLFLWFLTVLSYGEKEALRKLKKKDEENARARGIS